jgi:GGDEF domain-containing protein
MPNTDEHTASAVARNIYDECFQYDADKLIVSISFGYATKKTNGRKMSEYLIKAEDLMYKNKTKESKLFKTAVINKIEGRLFNTDYESLDEIGILKEISRQIAPYFHLSETEINKHWNCWRKRTIMGDRHKQLFVGKAIKAFKAGVERS